jgi:hypothetical protein
MWRSRARPSVGRKDRGLRVDRAPLESLSLGDLVRSLAGIFQTPVPGTQVTLLEDQGTVKMAGVTRAAAPGDVGAQVEALTRTVRNRERQVDRLRTRLEEMEARTTALADAGVSAERIARLESELTEMRGLREPLAEEKPRTAKPRRPRKPSS